MDPQPPTAAAAAAAGGHVDPIVKGKRTKRQRMQQSSSSIIPFAIVSHNSSSSYNAFNSVSPASSSDAPADSTTTEDEDTAECLILLSKGHTVSQRNNYNNDDQFSGYKFNSKRYIQTSTDAANGFAGMYVYECKTCSRTFPSFQALGGHRASHKKPRINELDKRKLSPYYAPFSDVDDEPLLQFPSRKNNSSSSSSLSLQLNHTKKSSANKLHECSICGTEFNSGQALGGHMRRHRVTNATSSSAGAGAGAATNTTLSLIPYSPVATVVAVDDQDYQKSRNDGLCLDLDLNLPAPPEAAGNHDQHRESSFKFTADQKKQQPAVRLSAAPTLVDCHY